MSEDRHTPVMPLSPHEATMVPTAAEIAAPSPWERQLGEGEREWCAFKAYRDMEPPRRMHRAGFLGGMRVASAELSEWYRKWAWDKRTEAFDVLTDRIVQDQRKRVLEQKTDDAMSDLLSTLQDLRKFLALEIRKYLTAAESTDGPGLIKVSELKGLMEVATKMTRLIMGESTEHTETTSNLSDMSIDELKEWRKRLTTLPAAPPALRVVKP